MTTIQQFNDYKDAFFYAFVLGIIYILLNLSTRKNKNK